MDQEMLNQRVMGAELNLVKLGESCKSAHKRVDELEQLTKSVYDLSGEVHVVVTQLKHIDQKLERLDNHLALLEKQPGEDFRHYKRTVIGSLLTGIGGSLLGAILAMLLRP